MTSQTAAVAEIRNTQELSILEPKKIFKICMAPSTSQQYSVETVWTWGKAQTLVQRGVTR